MYTHTHTPFPIPTANDKIRVAIVASRWHEDLVSNLIQGAQDAAKACGLEAKKIDVHRVHGAFELPQCIELLSQKQIYNAYVPLGVLIKGETNHFELICQTIFQAFDHIARQKYLPVTCGIVSAFSLEQAKVRCGLGSENKGRQAMLAGLDLCQLLNRLN